MRYKLFPGGYPPVRAHFDDAGIDLRTPFPFALAPGETRDINTKVGFEIPIGYCGLTLNKSGLNIKHQIVKETGVIDSSFRGPIVIRLNNQSDQTYSFREGDKLTQLVVLQCLCEGLEEAEELDEGYSGRGTDGYGSTGR